MKVGIDQLQSAINKILKEYGDDVYNRTEELTKAFAKKGAQAVKSAASSAVGGTGKYAKGWTSQVEIGRLSAVGTIYNRTPGLPHLLEHGHAKRGGGRVSGRTHIAPVEEKLVEEFTKAVEGAI